MAGGWIRADRDLFDDPWFCNGPATRLHAWADLIKMASHKAATVRTGIGPIELDRGQLTVSIRFLAERWQWSRTTVERFLLALENRDSIVREVRKNRDSSGTERGTGQLVLTVCNYDKYQSPEKPSGTAHEQNAGQKRDSTGTAPGTKYNKEQITNLPSEDNTPIAPTGADAREPLAKKVRRGRKVYEPRPHSPAQEARFQRFWEAYPKRVGRGDAYVKFRCFVDADQEDLIHAAAEYAAEIRQTDTLSLNPATFLFRSPDPNGKKGHGRWFDFITPSDEEASDGASEQDDNRSSSAQADSVGVPGAVPVRGDRDDPSHGPTLAVRPVLGPAGKGQDRRSEAPQFWDSADEAGGADGGREPGDGGAEPPRFPALAWARAS